MTSRQPRRILFGCYLSSFSTAVTGNLSPLLFLVFKEKFGLSYTLLGLLILVNFLTQLSFDLLFSFLWKHLPVKLSVKLTPVLIALGLVSFGLTPLFPGHEFPAMLIATVLFSCGAGLAEVLVSPVVAALPSDHPDRSMAALHSCYAWGVVFVVVLSTVFLRVCGSGTWYVLYLAFALLPIAAAILLASTRIPDISGGDESSGGLRLFQNKVLWLAVVCIFFGGASECTMSQWCSAYLEQAIGLPKIWGDIGGVAMFGLAMSLGRTLYAKKGRNTMRVLKVSAAGTIVCYLIAALTPVPVLGLFACALTGLCTAMLWPGSLVAARERIGDEGVGMYAMLAAGGDLGIVVCPELFGMIADAAEHSPLVSGLSDSLGVPENMLSMRVSLLLGAVIPALALVSFLLLEKHRPLGQ